MTGTLARMGLRSDMSLGATIPNYAGHFLLANFMLAYVLSATRLPKIMLGLDNNVSPRYDLGEKAEQAIAKGKITREQLDMLRRIQAAHSNGMEHYPVFAASMLLGLFAGLPNDMINKYGLIYTVARASYTLVYVTNTTRAAAGVRSVLWWVGNIVCIRLFWFAGKALNSQ